jgi:hypothetical protein
MSVTSTANVFLVTSTGANVAGTANITGNANVGNLGTTAIVLTTGNLTANSVIKGSGTGYRLVIPVGSNVWAT